MLIPIPTQNEPERIEGGKDYARIRWNMTWPNWVCTVCGTTMSGGSLYCAYCQLRNGITNPRPASYREPVYGMGQD